MSATVCGGGILSNTTTSSPKRHHRLAASYFVTLCYLITGIYLAYLAVLTLRGLPYYRYIPPSRRFFLLLTLSMVAVMLTGFFSNAFLPVADSSTSRLAFYSVANVCVALA